MNAHHVDILARTTLGGSWTQSLLNASRMDNKNSCIEKSKTARHRKVHTEHRQATQIIGDAMQRRNKKKHVSKMHGRRKHLSSVPVQDLRRVSAHQKRQASPNWLASALQMFQVAGPVLSQEYDTASRPCRPEICWSCGAAQTFQI